MRRISILAALASAAVGCENFPKMPSLTSTPTSRSQVADDLSEKSVAASVGQKTAVSNTEPIFVSAVGLVWNLKGTGSNAAGEWRPFLERNLRKQKFERPADVLDDPNHAYSMVLVSGAIPPGARKGDRIDLDVCLPKGSKTSSLKHGNLWECDLVTSEQSGAVREAMIQRGVDVGTTPLMSNTLLIGHTMVRGEGTLVVGRSIDPKGKMTSVDQELAAIDGGFTVGRVWTGGRVLEDRPYWFVLNEEEKSSRLAMEIATRLNATFQPGADVRSKTANAVTKEVVTVMVPPAYRLNHTRFLIVARQVPLLPVSPESATRKKLEQELLDPSMAIVSALKLEALGVESQQPLRVGLQSPSPWVRFASAEALTYLGSTAGIAELAKLAEQHPALRTHCLAAMASLDDGVSTDRLVELMSHPDAQLRYGAFVALRSANERHGALNGKYVKRQFWLHQVAASSKPMIHLNSTKRSEIVMFGNVPDMEGEFSIPVSNNFVIASKEGEDKITVTAIVQEEAGAKEVQQTVKRNPAAVLAAIGELGGGYSEAVEFLKRAEAAKVLSTEVAIDMSPRGLPLVQLARLGKSDPTLEQTNIDVARANQYGDGLRSGFDLPIEQDDTPKMATEIPALNRNPGRIFAQKKHPQDAAMEAETTKPAEKEKEKEKDTGPDLARSQGKLFGK